MGLVEGSGLCVLPSPRKKVRLAGIRGQTTVSPCLLPVRCARELGPQNPGIRGQSGENMGCDEKWECWRREHRVLLCWKNETNPKV